MTLRLPCSLLSRYLKEIINNILRIVFEARNYIYMMLRINLIWNSSFPTREFLPTYKLDSIAIVRFQHKCAGERDAHLDAQRVSHWNLHGAAYLCFASGARSRALYFCSWLALAHASRRYAHICTYACVSQLSTYAQSGNDIP